MRKQVITQAFIQQHNLQRIYNLGNRVLVKHTIKHMKTSQAVGSLWRHPRCMVVLFADITPLHRNNFE